jgi:hypothetical protein
MGCWEELKLRFSYHCYSDVISVARKSFSGHIFIPHLTYPLYLFFSYVMISAELVPQVLAS